MVWDFPLGLTSLKNLSYDPTYEIYLKYMSLIISFLLAIAAIKRAVELHALTMSSAWGIAYSIIQTDPIYEQRLDQEMEDFVTLGHGWVVCPTLDCYM